MDLGRGSAADGSFGFDAAESGEAGKGRRAGRDRDDAGPSSFAAAMSAVGLLVDSEAAAASALAKAFLTQANSGPWLALSLSA